MHGHSAGLGADVGAGQCERLLAHLAETPYEGVVRDTNTDELSGRTAESFKIF